jgi:hypothetical protein
MTQYQEHNHPALEVEAFLHVEARPEAFACEILACNPVSEVELITDEGCATFAAPGEKAIRRYRFESRRSADTERAASDHLTLCGLAVWISGVLADTLRTESASAIPLISEEFCCLDWLIVPLRSTSSLRVLAAVGLADPLLTLTGENSLALAGHLQNALAI